MKVKDLIKEINSCKKQWKSFLDWEVYTEQCPEGDKKVKRTEQKWKIVTDSDDWEYFRCAGEGYGFFTKFPRKKIFTINVNY